MQRYWKLVLAGGVILGSMIGLSMAAPAAKAGTRSDNATARMAGDYCTKYLCQKCYNGCWHTCCVCYDYNQAMNWYDAQDGNARVIAQK
jgi:hypothetical protein